MGKMAGKAEIKRGWGFGTDRIPGGCFKLDIWERNRSELGKNKGEERDDVGPRKLKKRQKRGGGGFSRRGARRPPRKKI